MAGILSFLNSLRLISSLSVVAAIANGCDFLCLVIRQEIFLFLKGMERKNVPKIPTGEQDYRNSNHKR